MRQDFEGNGGVDFARGAAAALRLDRISSMRAQPRRHGLILREDTPNANARCKDKRHEGPRLQFGFAINPDSAGRRRHLFPVITTDIGSSERPKIIDDNVPAAQVRLARTGSKYRRRSEERER